jgi:hypothetical protein
MPVIPTTARSMNRKMVVQAGLEEKARSYIQNKQSKKDWRNISNGRVPS